MATTTRYQPTIDGPARISISNQADTKPDACTAEIIAQVEYYFDDDNLRQDAHLLALFQDGNGSVSLSDVCHFRKMRKFKSESLVRDALRHSDLIEISVDGTRLKRKFPLTKPLTVQPKINPARKKNPALVEKPWLTKGMLKPTGFEEYATEGPIKPTEYEEDCKDYEPGTSFTYRIETAIMRFCARRKMHQESRSIFEMFMLFGGMDTNQRQFTGGPDRTEDLTKKEIAELTSYYGICEQVLDGFREDVTDEPVTWYVDFELVAKAFLSSHFVAHCDWYNEEKIAAATNILRNFYNYLLLHDVCPEFRDNLLAARRVCDVAEQEFLDLKQIDLRLPGGFNVACSTIFPGSYNGLNPAGGDWVRTDDKIGWSAREAELIFSAAIFAHGTAQQIEQFEEAIEEGTPCEIISFEQVGLEITGVEYPDPAAKSIYNSPEFQNTIVRPMGKLRCKRWNVPHAPPRDLPNAVKAALKKPRAYEFFVDEETLEFCRPGMRIEACVKELDLGFQWIDCVDAVYASFFSWLPNENIREWKEPGAPKEWMVRALQKRGVEYGDGGGGEDEGKVGKEAMQGVEGEEDVG